MQIKTILFMMISIIPFTCLAQKSKQVKAIKKSRTYRNGR